MIGAGDRPTLTTLQRVCVALDLKLHQVGLSHEAWASDQAGERHLGRIGLTSERLLGKRVTNQSPRVSGY